MRNIRRGLTLTRSRIEKIFPKLTPAQISRIAAHIHMPMIQRDEALLEQGYISVPFFVVISGETEVVRPAGSAETLVAVYDSGQFTGEATCSQGVEPYFAGVSLSQAR